MFFISILALSPEYKLVALNGNGVTVLLSNNLIILSTVFWKGFMPLKGSK